MHPTRNVLRHRKPFERDPARKDDVDDHQCSVLRREDEDVVG
jgi:hypothetical protein